ncbi:hypothetical protein I3760_02G050800 [Carya illinoinensis]|nr:hypothetical protein I3760_02G050800 [Carya illinoinensis]KAG2720775.1 hypothetical protein I3760_02G050800 [Carya illinoinensis]KAG2720776.1 hypothetical protein I3760_02G050800 [Carya illinoinensis]KAG2720777.1 hypothetical protein I3760_02G050800 [Carya illinoinensis]KAG2720778.1 hypothetical protein I3760_02G050800 [Carya illinoinensis]
MSVPWRAFSSLGALSMPHRSFAAPYSEFRFRCSSMAGYQETSTEPFDMEPRSEMIKPKRRKMKMEKPNDFVPRKDEQEQNKKQGEEEEERISISKLQVPRQKYIPVSKAELLDAIVSMMFESQKDGDDSHEFLLLSSCLDSIVHAEHKIILEEMRTDYFFAHSTGKEETFNEGSDSSDRQSVTNEEELDNAGDGINGVGSLEGYENEDIELDTPISFIHGLDLRNLLGSLDKNVKKYSDSGSRVAIATRFQRNFMQLLYDAQFEELSARDLMLTSALNTDYLLTLPIYVDWKKASESNAIIFRRGYATERQKGLLIVEKLDYIQSKLLRGLFFIISKPLGKLGSWIDEALKVAIQTQEVQEWTKRMKLWLEELSVFPQLLRYSQNASDDLPGVQQLSDRDLPIWLAAQRAVSRYEGILSPVGPRGRLLRKLLSWIGVIPATPEVPYESDSDSNASEPYKRPIFLSRISLSDIWRPAKRKYCGNNFWKMFQTSISILFSQSILQEPAFQELILLYTKEDSKGDPEIRDEVSSLQLKIYERIPIPDLPVVFPHKKLSFRIIDTVRLDAATVVGLLAFFINYKFEDVLSSPSAILLDAVAISALIIYVTRVALGYKQTWDRYQLLVNKTLYEKTLASGFGSVHFLLDASEQQQYKEAILAYAILLRAEKGQVPCCRSIGDKCERFMYDAFKVKVEMPIDEAIDTLMRLGLVTETSIDGSNRLQAVPCPKAYEGLKERWNGLLR